MARTFHRFYQGEFKKNKYNGFGIEYKPNGADISHQGEWRDDNPFGAASIKRRDAGFG